MYIRKTSPLQEGGGEIKTKKPQTEGERRKEKKRKTQQPRKWWSMGPIDT